jgi:hypothetical protein
MGEAQKRTPSQESKLKLPEGEEAATLGRRLVCFF